MKNPDTDAKHENAAVPVRFTDDLPVRSNHGGIGWPDFLGTGDEHETNQHRRRERRKAGVYSTKK